MRKIVLIVLLIMTAITVSITFAQAETPAESSADNACFAGGLLEGKCDWPTEAETLWAWTCGWYIARAENGVPTWCNYTERMISAPFVLPNIIVGICYMGVSGDWPQITFFASLNSYENVTILTTSIAPCTGNIRYATVVAAPDVSSAIAICQGVDVRFTGAILVPPLYNQHNVSDVISGVLYECS